MQGTFHASANAMAKAPTGHKAWTTTASGVHSPNQRCTAEERRRMLADVSHDEA
jgi:hypothetical protein